jgi:3-oxoacyl-[acyl-carrier-protein] synthase II
VETPIDLVPYTARPRKIDVVLSNSFGFGGTNASLVLRRLQ